MVAISAFLARDGHLVREAQRLRCMSFCQQSPQNPGSFLRPESMTACPDGRERDIFDSACWHIVIYDSNLRRAIGTCRLLDRAGAFSLGGFYTQSEFDISALLHQDARILEMGRLCLDHTSHRSKGIILRRLWRTLAQYIEDHRIDYLFGCVSLPGMKIKAYRRLLSDLHANYLAPEDICPQPLDVSLDIRSIIQMDRISKRSSLQPLNLSLMPSLLALYLRLGGRIGQGIFIDHQWQMIDLCVVVRTGARTSRYHRRAQQLA